MTDITEAQPAPSEDAGFAADLTQSHTLGESVQAYISRVRGGDMGALPSVLGLVVLFIVFGFANDRFLSNLNLANLLTQSGSIIILAMALVPVLLLGDIDLSAGVAGGVVRLRHGRADRRARPELGRRGRSPRWRPAPSSG